MKGEVSALERARAAHRPQLPRVLDRGVTGLGVDSGKPTGAVGNPEEIRKRFPGTFGRPALKLVPGAGPARSGPLRVGVVLSGGQAPGGHNVISGLFDGLRRIHASSKLLGFLGGPKGVLTGSQRELTADVVEPYRNTGGFDMLGSGRDKIETDRQLAASRAACEGLSLDGLVIVGGDDSNTNAAVLAEYFLQQGVPTSVVGVPKTIDGDLKGSGVEASFGFDTTTKIYSELIGNLCRDAKSAGKYWHFIRLMGRSTSHVTLECALQTHANIALISEEVQEAGLRLEQIVDRIAEVVRRRSLAGKSYGICLVPEGLIEFIPEIRVLIDELNAAVSREAGQLDRDLLAGTLSEVSRRVFDNLPQQIQQQLLLDRDAHGNVQVSRIDTERLLIDKLKARLGAWRDEGRFPGKLQVQNHFFGYEGRSAAPSNFDAAYTYALGSLAAALVAFSQTGYMCAVTNLAAPPVEWEAMGVPLISMMQMEMRKGRPTPVIAKALVRTDGAPFGALVASRDQWELGDEYLYPGAIQYFGPPEVSDGPTRTLLLEHAASSPEDGR